jgi:hypothetical protein
MAKNVLKTNEILRAGEYIASHNGAFYCILQRDGNLCVYAGTGPNDQRDWLWSASTTGWPIGDYFAAMQGDGNLCVYRGTGPGDNHGLVWQTGNAHAGSDKEFFLLVNFRGELGVYAGPFPPPGQPRTCWKTDQMREAPFSLQEIHELIQKYGPMLYFHPHERYFMASVEWHLEQSTLHDNKTGTKIRSPKPSDLPTGPVEGDRYWLELPDAAKGGNMESARAYVHVRHELTKGHTDLQFWFFSSYNGPGTAFLKSWIAGIEASRGSADLAPLGEHYGDWEYVSLRISHIGKELMSVFFSQHGGGQRLNNADLEHHNKQVVVYASRNGHANYPHASENFSEYRKLPIGLGTYVEFMLRNDTARGVALDCSKRYEIISADSIEPKSPEPAWLNYPYRWGPVSSTTSMSSDSIRALLRAALGVVAVVLEFTLLSQLAQLLLPMFVKDDRNGPVGPKQHAGSWNGDE